MRVVEVSFPGDGQGEISFPISRTISGNGLERIVNINALR
jgi:hypothetical protein